MKKYKEIKITYVYHVPKTPEEKEEQKRKVNEVFDDIFERISKRLKDNQF